MWGFIAFSVLCNSDLFLFLRELNRQNKLFKNVVLDLFYTKRLISELNYLSDNEIIPCMPSLSHFEDYSLVMLPISLLPLPVSLTTALAHVHQ